MIVFVALAFYFDMSRNSSQGTPDLYIINILKHSSNENGRVVNYIPIQPPTIVSATNPFISLEGLTTNTWYSIVITSSNKVRTSLSRTDILIPHFLSNTLTMKLEIN